MLSTQILIWENLLSDWVKLRDELTQLNEEIRLKLSRLFGITADKISDDSFGTNGNIILLIAEVRGRMDEEIQKIQQPGKENALILPSWVRRKNSKKYHQPPPVKTLHDLDRPFLLEIADELWWNNRWSRQELEILLRAIRLLRNRMQFAINHPDSINQDSSLSWVTIDDTDHLIDARLHNARARPVKFRS